MRAVILAGGRGTRLAPYTTVIPKPLLPVGDMPILEVIVRQLAHAGVERITLTLGYQSTYFRAFLAQHRALRRLVKIDFVEEEKPTGTAGSLCSVPGLDDTFLVMNGDILTDLDYRELFDFHGAAGASLTIAAHRKPVRIDLGVLETDRDGAITNYIEKPTMDYAVSMGIYVYDPAVLELIVPGEYLDFPDLVLRLLRAGKKAVAFRNNARWLDLGRHEDFLQAAELFQERSHAFLPPAPDSRRRQTRPRFARLAPEAEPESPGASAKVPEHGW
jgi:NDP-sugar pyrophosphorylase family protein